MRNKFDEGRKFGSEKEVKSLLRIDKMLNLGNPEVKKSEKVEVK